MLKTEYIRNLNRNYVSILLERQPDYKRYQYCILDRGGIKYLLSCSCKSINGAAYLYYDISSTQNVRQIFSGKCIGRDWMKAFFWSMQKMKQELTRFLLDERNVVWDPEYIFQDLEKNDFKYLYIPYCGQEGELDEGFEKLLEFWVEKVDYNDDALSEFVYHAYEQFICIGHDYLETQIFEDYNKLEEKKRNVEEKAGERALIQPDQGISLPERAHSLEGETEEEAVEVGSEKKKILSFWDGRRRRQEQKNTYREDMRRMINGYAVCEESEYGQKTDKSENVASRAEEYGRTIYIEEREDETHGLLTEKGELAVKLDKFPFVLGKRKEDADYVLEDYSVSRIHARFTREEDGIYLEDLNSTNGTFKNGLRMQPYEKRKLEAEDCLRFGKTAFVFK